MSELSSASAPAKPIVRALCAFLIIFATACQASSTISEVMTAYLEGIERGATSSELNIGEQVPKDWKTVCLGFFPYVSRANLEEKLKGTAAGPLGAAEDSSWLLLGIDANRVITPIQLERKSAQLLAVHFQAPTQYVCAVREKAILTPVSTHNTLFLKLGSP